MTILSGCKTIDAPIVKVSDYCDRQESLWLVKQDFDNIAEIRTNEKHRKTIDKYIDYHARNEKEYGLCAEITMAF